MHKCTYVRTVLNAAISEDKVDFDWKEYDQLRICTSPSYLDLKPIFSLSCLSSLIMICIGYVIYVQQR